MYKTNLKLINTFESKTYMFESTCGTENLNPIIILGKLLDTGILEFGVMVLPPVSIFASDLGKVLDCISRSILRFGRPVSDSWIDSVGDHMTVIVTVERAEGGKE